jgi:hypothetical protein
MELFFGVEDELPEARARREAEAIAICKSPCPVRLDCLVFHLRRGVRIGVAGGFGERDRFLMRKSLMRVYPGEVFPVDAIQAAMAKADIPKGMRPCGGPCGQPRPRAEFGPRRRGGFKYRACAECRAQALAGRKAAA